jgi:molybdopterin converting factor small subunit
VAVDGVVANDWSTRLSDGSEVLLVPRIAGGV